MTRLRIGVVAGEPSGDALGAQVLAALGKRCDVVLAEGVGGPRMEAEGMVSLYPVERLAVMGLVEPLKRLPELLRINRALGRHFVQKPPDVFLGIDAPDFNLRLEKRLRRAGITTAHLVSPSVWAWRRSRLRGIARAVDLMLCLFPFETDIYRRHDLPVRHVGHPLADEIDPDVDRLSMRRQLGLETEGPLLAVLPGSREAEVRLLAPVFLQAARLLRRENPRLTLAIPAAGRERHAQLQGMLAAFDDLPVRLIPGRSRDVMAAADAVLLASGTATLEAALLRRPMVVAYRMGEVSWWLLSRLVRTPYVALPNLLAGRLLVPELLQKAATPDALAAAMQPLLAGNEAVDRQLQGFGELRGHLGQGAADAVASALLELAAAAGTHSG